MNTRTHGVHHGGGEYKWDRRTKKNFDNQKSTQGMNPKFNGRDYTPLFKFLLSRVGRDWKEVHSEATSRLDTPEPIGWMVSEDPNETKVFFRAGESSYYSKLYVDEENILRKVDPGFEAENMEPSHWNDSCSFNGIPVTKKYDSERFHAFAELWYKNEF